MTISCRLIQLFHTNRNADIGTCNLCTLRIEMFKVLESVWFQPLTIEISGIKILCIIENKKQKHRQSIEY